MIDEKKLIEILSKNSIFEKITNAEGKNIFEIIEEQPQAVCSRREWYKKGYQDGLNADKWIPCSKRLPELDEGNEPFKQSKKYLVTTQWSDGQIEVDIDWYNQGGMWSSDSKYCKVIAWQERPLPHPYKKEGGE